MNVLNTINKDLMISRFLGVFPYDLTNKFALNYKLLAYSVSFTLIFIIHSLNQTRMDIRNATTVALIKLAFLDTVESTLMAAAISLFCIKLCRRSRNLQLIYRGFLKADVLFHRLGVQKYRRRLWRNNLKLVYFWPSCVLILYDIQRFVQEGFRNYGYLHLYLISFLHTICNIKLFGIAMTFSVFTDLLGDYLTTLNAVVMSDTSNTSKRCLPIIVRTCDSLLDIVPQINSVFASTLLIMVLNCFVKCTDNFYKIIKGDDSLYGSVFFAVWMAVVGMQLLMLVQSVNYPLKQADLYGWLMYRKVIKSDPSLHDETLYAKLMLHIMHRKKVEFNLCGFITLDNALLGKISAATLTYSIILSQLSPYSLPSADEL